MGKYVLRRVLIALPMLLVITLIIFLLANALPGDAVSAMFGSTEAGVQLETVEQMRQNLGLNDPLPIRYLKWTGQILRGNLGTSMISFESVSSMIAQRIGPTLLLMGSSLLISLIAGVILGIVSAIKQYSVIDYIMTVLVFIGRSVPVFFVGMLFIYFLALVIPIFPASGFSTVGIESAGDKIRHLILPMLSLSVLRMAEFLRYTRASMLEVMHGDFIWTARSKGIREKWVIIRHALRNALIPIITLLGLNIPVLFSGAIVIEQVFQWPGIGILFNRAIVGRDYPLIMGLCLISSVIVLLSNLLTDLAYAAVDPRIRYK